MPSLHENMCLSPFWKVNDGAEQYSMKALNLLVSRRKTRTNAGKIHDLMPFEIREQYFATCIRLDAQEGGMQLPPTGTSTNLPFSVNDANLDACWIVIRSQRLGYYAIQAHTSFLWGRSSSTCIITMHSCWCCLRSSNRSQFAASCKSHSNNFLKESEASQEDEVGWQLQHMDRFDLKNVTQLSASFSLLPVPDITMPAWAYVCDLTDQIALLSHCILRAFTLCINTWPHHLNNESAC